MAAFELFVKCVLDRDSDGASQQLHSMQSIDRTKFLRELSGIVFRENNNIGRLPISFQARKNTHFELFQCLLFDFMIPLFHQLVKAGRWNEALEFENSLYTSFIKQDESEEFYNQTFGKLYEPFRQLQSQPKRSEKKFNISENLRDDKKILFWLPNLNHLAHVDVLLTFLDSLSDCKNIFVSALENNEEENASAALLNTGVSLLDIDQKLNVAERYKMLVKLCIDNQIQTIVFVSLPLHSGYIRTLTHDINIVWWSMKFALGSVKHFDRLVCYRSLVPEIRVFNGENWFCSPFSVKRINLLSDYTNRNPSDSTDLRLGVLAREEKFASSELPDLLNIALLNTETVRIFWTGRIEDSEIAKRLMRGIDPRKKSPSNFVGWVDPERFLNFIDVLVDTPNLGGMVAYWAMSIGKIVISATKNGSIGALASPELLSQHFEYLRDEISVDIYFSSTPSRPFYLSDEKLIPRCISNLEKNKELIKIIGKLFGDFFNSNISDLEESSKITLALLSGAAPINDDLILENTVMEKIKINQARLSNVTWDQIFENSVSYQHENQSRIFQKANQLDSLRDRADYNTGSITTSAIWTIFSSVLFFKPRLIAEVGTFIGKSTLAMAFALDMLNHKKSEVFTCDFSNAIDLNLPVKTKITQFKKQSSTDMFTGILKLNRKIDMLMLDGRLQTEDFSLLSNLLHGESIILLDDFEGVEKGCINAVQLMESLKNTHMLIYPPTINLLTFYGLQDRCTLAMIVPKELIVLSSQ